MAVPGPMWSKGSGLSSKSSMRGPVLVIVYKIFSSPVFRFELPLDRTRVQVHVVQRILPMTTGHPAIGPTPTLTKLLCRPTESRRRLRDKDRGRAA
jgi:hypothetical protein